MAHGAATKPSGSTAGGLPEVIVAYGKGSTVVASRSYAGLGGNPGHVWSCLYFALTTNPGPGFSIKPDFARGPITPIVGELNDLICYENGVLVDDEIFTFDPANPFGPIAAGVDAAQLARNVIPLPNPDIRTSPPRTGPLLVGLPTWYWVGDSWAPRTASASAGGVTATITATPTAVEWHPGDGSGALTCTGPGTAWNPAHPDATSTCQHTYTWRSTMFGGTGTFDLGATITYEVAWTATNGQGGTLAPLTRTTTVPIVVQEAQAVVE